jgi:hypothetical protein
VAGQVPVCWGLVSNCGPLYVHSMRRYIGDGSKLKYFTIWKSVSQTSMLSKGGAIRILGGAIPILGGAILILGGAIPILGGAIPTLGGAILSLNLFSIYKKVIAFLTVCYRPSNMVHPYTLRNFLLF